MASTTWLIIRGMSTSAIHMTPQNLPSMPLLNGGLTQTAPALLTKTSCSSSAMLTAVIVAVTGVGKSKFSDNWLTDLALRWWFAIIQLALPSGIPLSIGFSAKFPRIGLASLYELSRPCSIIFKIWQLKLDWQLKPSWSNVSLTKDWNMTHKNVTISVCNVAVLVRPGIIFSDHMLVLVDIRLLMSKVICDWTLRVISLPQLPVLGFFMSNSKGH